MDNNYIIVDIGNGCYVKRNICNDNVQSNTDNNRSFTPDGKAIILEANDE